MIAAGKYAERITLQSPLVSQNEIGEVVSSWGAGTVMWAEVTTLRGQEFFSANQAQFRVDIRVRVRWRAGITNQQSIVWRGQRYAVREVMDGGPRRDYIELLCSSGVRDGQ